MSPIRLTALSALGAALAAPLAAQGLEPFRFGANWVAQPEHGGYYQALVDGSYAACGLEVEIVPGGPQVNNRALLLAGRLDAYMGGNMLQAFRGVAEDIPFVVVAADFQKDPQVLMTHPGRAASFEDLKDMTLFISDIGLQTFYPWLVSAHGFTTENRRPYAFNPAPFIADPDSAQQGYVTSEPFAIEREAGWRPDVWLLADYGFDTYSNTIEVTRDTLEARPEAVDCFVDASALGWIAFLYGDNAAAIERIRRDNPDLTEAQIDHAIGAIREHGLVDSGDALELGIGAITEARMQAIYEQMVEAGVLEPGLDISQAYAPGFVDEDAALERRRELLGR